MEDSFPPFSFSMRSFYSTQFPSLTFYPQAPDWSGFVANLYSRLLFHEALACSSVSVEHYPGSQTTTFVMLTSEGDQVPARTFELTSASRANVRRSTDAQPFGANSLHGGKRSRSWLHLLDDDYPHPRKHFSEEIECRLEGVADLPVNMGSSSSAITDSTLHDSNFPRRPFFARADTSRGVYSAPVVLCRAYSDELLRHPRLPGVQLASYLQRLALQPFRPVYWLLDWSVSVVRVGSVIQIYHLVRLFTSSWSISCVSKIGWMAYALP